MAISHNSTMIREKTPSMAILVDYASILAELGP
jgi:hypothetical protein